MLAMQSSIRNYHEKHYKEFCVIFFRSGKFYFVTDEMSGEFDVSKKFCYHDSLTFVKIQIQIIVLHQMFC